MPPPLIFRDLWLLSLLPGSCLGTRSVVTVSVLPAPFPTGEKPVTLDQNQRHRIAEAEAQSLLPKLPTNIRAIVERLPFGARWMQAGAISELLDKRDVYSTGIAIGMVLAASVGEEITDGQKETLALYVGNICPDRLMTK